MTSDYIGKLLYHSVKQVNGTDMPVATLSSKFQLVLPAEIRKQFGIKAGDRLIVGTEGETITLRPAPSSHVEALDSLRSLHWQGYAEELHRERSEWDR